MSWQDYVDNQLIASQCVKKAAIAGLDGTIWAKSEGFEVSGTQEASENGDFHPAVVGMSTRKGRRRRWMKKKKKFSHFVSFAESVPESVCVS